MTDLLNAALAYAALGWPVLPLHGWTGTTCTCGRQDCPSPAKHPRTQHGLKDAITDRDAIEAAWARWPDANLGLLTGVTFDVLDVDGDDAIDALMVHAGTDPSVEGPMSSTGRGYHLLYRPTGEGNRTRLVDHVDWRGLGGYIVAPPSVHATGRRYQWLPGCGPETPLQPVPAWLAGLVVRPAFVPPGARPAPVRNPDTHGYGRGALERELGQLAMAQPGTRNDALNRAAFSLGQLVAGGELDAGEVVASLLLVAERIGLATTEADATIASGLRRGLETPRRRPA